MLSIGLMSGTSMDGIDAALLETDGTPQHIHERDHIFIPYDPRFTLLLKSAEYAVRSSQGNITLAHAHYLSLLHTYLQDILHKNEQEISDILYSLSSYLTLSLEAIILHSTKLHAIAVKKLLSQAKLSAKHIDVIGYHGQTLFHQPQHKISIIIGEGKYLAELLSITVVNDFRRRDILAGGQGAPFAPLYHQALAIRDHKIPLAVVNCGGISNITFIDGNNDTNVSGFDTGPGNALLDTFIRQRTQGKENMDQDGRYGKKGTVHQKTLKALYATAVVQQQHNYFSLQPPKSLDYGDIKLIPELDQLSLEDGCATIAAFTADSIITSVEQWYAVIPQHWILAGGGWKNPVIYNEFKKRLIQKGGSSIKIQLADEAGWNAAAMEAYIFAYFAVRSLQNKVLSLPSTTNVPFPLSGGHAYIPPQGPTQKVATWLAKNPAVLNA